METINEEQPGENDLSFGFETAPEVLDGIEVETEVGQSAT